METGSVKPSLPLKRSITSAAPDQCAQESFVGLLRADKGRELVPSCALPEQIRGRIACPYSQKEDQGQEAIELLQAIEEEKGQGKKDFRQDEHDDRSSDFPIQRGGLAMPGPPS